MPLIFLLHLLLAACIVSITPATSTSTSTSSAASSSQSTLTASPPSATTTSSSASSTPTSSAASNAFQWNGGEIAALVILLGFFVFGIALIATWQVRRMVARRRDNATIEAYAEHAGNPLAEMDFTKTDAAMTMSPRSEHFPYNPPPAFQHANDDLERQPTAFSAPSFRNSTPTVPGSSIYVSPRNSIRHSRSPSPHSEAVLRPTSQSNLRRLFSFEDLSRSTIGDSSAEGVDRMSAVSNDSASAPLSSSPRQI
jgi:hypothetical protein